MCSALAVELLFLATSTTLVSAGELCAKQPRASQTPGAQGIPEGAGLTKCGKGQGSKGAAGCQKSGHQECQRRLALQEGCRSRQGPPRRA